MRYKIININVYVVIAISLLFAGCENDKNQFNVTVFPTNLWKVVGQGTNGQVLVETKTTNLLQRLRVHVATAVVPLTNGQVTRVEFTTRWNPTKGIIEIVNSKAYPAVE